MIAIVSRWLRFLKSKDYRTAALESNITDYITPAGLTIRAVRTDNGGEFGGTFQRKFDELGIIHELTPPGNIGDDERALGLLREKTIAIVKDLKKQDMGARIESFWTEAWKYATTGSYRMICGMTSLLPLGNCTHSQRSIIYGKLRRDNKLEPRGEKCILLAFSPPSHPRHLQGPEHRTQQIVHRQNVSR